MHWKSKLLAGLFVALMGTAPAVAQESPRDEIAEMDEVTITASPLNKAFEVNAGAFGARDKMEVPLVIQSYDSNSIHSTATRTVADVLTILDPSITSSSYGGSFDNFRLRGFTGDLYNTVRLDGLALAPHQDMPLELVERVDVLKGPAGFLFGINSPGGTINLLPKRPTRDPFTSVTLQGSSLKGRYVALDTSNAFFDGHVGYRLNAGYEKIGDFDHFGDLERQFAGLTTDFRLNDRALLQLNTSWAKKSAMADPLLRADQSGRADPLDPGSFVLPPKVNRRDALSPSWFRHIIETTNLDAKFEYTLTSHWTAVAQGNFSRVEQEAAYSDLFDIQPNGEIGFADLAIRRGSRSDSWTGQGYLSGVFDAFGVFHEVFTGLSYHKNHDRSPIWDIDESNGGVSVGDVSVGNILHPVQPLRIHYGSINDLAYNSNIQESSVFLSDLISFNDRFQAMLGGRYIWFRAKDHYAGALPESKNIFVPTAALMYRPTPSLMTYFSYSRGLERGEFAPYNAVNANQSTDAIESRQYEIGLKAQFGQDSSLGLALFDLQRDASYLNSANYFVSNGKYTHRGMELTGATRLFQHLTLAGSLAYLDTELKKVDDPTTLGKRSAGAPRWKGAFHVRYALPFLPGLAVDSTGSYVGSSPVDAQNSGFIPGYMLWDAGMSYDTQLGAIATTFRLQARNLTDKYYYPGVNSGGLQIGRGREVFLSARFRF